MIVKGLATLSVLLALVSAPALLSAQTTVHPTPGKPGLATPPVAAQGEVRPDCNGIPCEDQQPRVIVVPPAPTPIQWPWHDRVLWAAYLVLAILGYAGLMLGRSTLRQIERHTAAAEQTAATAAAAANAAAETAHAALLHAQAIVHAERPWILVTAEPTGGVESSFEITAINRGRSPATITATMDQVLFAADEAQLPEALEFKPVESAARFVPIILLPGESATLKTFGRDDARGLCASDEQFANIQSWAERLFLCGKVSYNDLIAPAGNAEHETNWCCWYIHGKQRSALVPAGPAAYNAHT
jgi:hypothetical protein